MKKCGGTGDITPPFLTSALDGVVAKFMPQPLYQIKKTPGL
jgi:hypothetical protein